MTKYKYIVEYPRVRVWRLGISIRPNSTWLRSTHVWDDNKWNDVYGSQPPICYSYDDLFVAIQEACEAVQKSDLHPNNKSRHLAYLWSLI